MNLLRVTQAAGLPHQRMVMAQRSINQLRHISQTSARHDASTPAEKQDKIIRTLTEKFTPSDLQVQDISGGCGSFFAIMLKSKEFKGKSTIQAHRMVNKEIKDVIQDIHGLQVCRHLLTPSSRPLQTTKHLIISPKHHSYSTSRNDGDSQRL